MNHLDRTALRKEIADVMQAGTMELDDILVKYDVSLSHVYKACKENGVRIKRRVVTDARMVKIIGRLFDPTRTFASIASELQVTTQYIHVTMLAAKDAGIQVPKRSKPT